MSGGWQAQRERALMVQVMFYGLLAAPLFVGLLGVGIEALSLIWE